MKTQMYPRPQFRRDDWLPLDGQWQFCYDDSDDGEARTLPFDLKINVPFSYQYPASGIGDPAYHPAVWYKREFTVPNQMLGKSALLCFNAAFYAADVWVNGKFATSHIGGFSPFSADITPLLSAGGKNEVVVRCRTYLTPSVPRGKQSWTNERFSCWYTPNSGLWQSVWIDFFGGDAVKMFTLTPDIDSCSISGDITTLRGVADSAEIKIMYDGKPVKTARISLDGEYTRYQIGLMEVNFVDEVHYWTPEHPNLFYADITLYSAGQAVDGAHTRFGMRKISVDNGGHICLNNRRYYQKLVLDQGYWQESGLTPPSPEALKRDIELAKQMGFNGARKHQKTEDPYFYYYADELGFLTWCEMPSAYNYCPSMIAAQSSEWQEIVGANRNFTSVVCYVPLNESWGVRKILTSEEQQNYARAMYYITKAIDPSRLVSTNDGWECVTETDVLGIHDYAYSGADFAERYTADSYDTMYPQGRKLYAVGNCYCNQPVIFSEFGGIAMKTDTAGGNWGYNSAARNADELYARLADLLDGIAKCDFDGYCYTQLTDVQQEVNGLLDEQHNPKFDIAKIKAIQDKV